MNAKVYPSDELCMDGKELRRLRMAAGLSERELAKKMGWYRKKVERYEKSVQFCLHRTEMQEILKVLGSGER